MKAIKRKPQATKNEWESVAVSEDIEGNLNEKTFNSMGLTSIEASALLKLHGKNELPEKVIPKWYDILTLNFIYNKR